MVRILRVVAGIIAVIFSIQPLASWASRTKDKGTNLTLSKNDSSSPHERGSPTCIGGTKTLK